MVRALRLSRIISDRGAALAADAEGAQLLPHGRHCRGAYHLAAGAAGRVAELGLPLLLAARRDLHAAGADACGVSGGSPGLGRVAAPQLSPARRRSCRRCTAWPASAGYRSGRCRGWPATAVPARSASATRPARQLQLDVYGELIDAMYQEVALGLVRPTASWDLQRALVAASRADLGATRREHLGSARRGTELHLLQGNGVGRGGSRDPRRRTIQPAGAAGTLASVANADP